MDYIFPLQQKLKGGQYLWALQREGRYEVAPGERLSDHVYEYDAEERSIVRADKAEERRQEKETMQKVVKTAEERAASPEKAAARGDKADRDEGRVSFKQKLPEMKEKAAEQTKANPVAENAKKKAQEIA